MQITSILFSVLGLLIGHRTLLQIERRELIARRFSRALMIIWTAIAIVVARAGSSALQLLAITTMIGAPTAISWWLERARKRALERGSRLLVDEMLLAIRAGAGFRDGLKSAMGNGDGSMKVLRTVVSANGLHRAIPDWAESELGGRVLRRVLELEHASTKVVDQLGGLRRSMIVAGKLQRKIKTASDPAKIQGIMVGLMYFGVCLYQFGRKSGFFELKTFWISLFLITIAGLFAKTLLRRFRWTLSRGF